MYRIAHLDRLEHASGPRGWHRFPSERRCYERGLFGHALTQSFCQLPLALINFGSRPLHVPNRQREALFSALRMTHGVLA